MQRFARSGLGYAFVVAPASHPTQAGQGRRRLRCVAHGPTGMLVLLTPLVTAGIPLQASSHVRGPELTRRDGTGCLRLDDAAWGIVQVPRLEVEASGPPLASLGSRCTGTFALIRSRVGVRRHGVAGSGGRSHGAVALNKRTPRSGSRGGTTPGPRSLSLRVRIPRGWTPHDRATLPRPSVGRSVMTVPSLHTRSALAYPPPRGKCRTCWGD